MILNLLPLVLEANINLYVLNLINMADGEERPILMILFFFHVPVARNGRLLYALLVFVLLVPVAAYIWDRLSRLRQMNPRKKA